MALTHVAFCFCFTTCNLSRRTRTVPDPFTGQPITVAIDDGLTADECNSLRAVMKESGFEKSEISGEGYELRLSEDGQVRLRGEIEVGYRGFAVELVVRRLTDEMLDLVLSLARVGNLALTSSTGQDVRLPHVPASKLVAERWPAAPILGSPDELRHWLERVIGGRPVRVGHERHSR